MMDGGHVILLHGLWMRSLTLLPLGRRLREAGFDVETMDYASTLGGPERAAEKLLQRMHAHRGNLHLVGHSLGGLIALRALAAARSGQAGGDGRVVCLGSPLCGSAAARSLAHWRGGRWLMGRSTDLLCTGLERWDGPNAVGVVAGRLPLGLGFVLGPLAGDHDGTVSVGETQLPGIADHRTVPTSHSGLLLSREAADQTIAFLRSGHFLPPRQAAA
ncbi:lipase family alpha/beta hydrolase [Dokdonella koreensis]|nr:alpha/beta fold hydrolase [Dokdonella koreensis]